MGYSTSTKNAAKVQFPEVLKLGRTILSPESERRYRLVSIVCHKGSSHDSGHYESFRRCVVREPVGTKVNEEVWRWVGNRSRSRAVSRAASTACSNGESNARNGSVAEGAVNGQGQQQVRQPDDAGFAAKKSPSSLSFQIDEPPRNELNGASSTRTPSIATASASQAPTNTAETTPRSSPSLVGREENIISPSQSQSQSQSQDTFTQQQQQQQQQPPPPPENPSKPERPSRLRRTTSKGAATLQSLRSSGSEEKKKKKKAAAEEKKSKTHSDRWFRVSDEK
ncbi:hypothetical protein KEM55_001678, partial [Ascosphaera atra]